MIFEQYKYPFTQINENNCISFEKSKDAIEKRCYRQIGIEHPHSVPIFKFYETDDFSPEIDHENDWEPSIIVKIDNMTESEVAKEKDKAGDKNDIIHVFPGDSGDTRTNYHDFVIFDKDIYEINLYRNESKIIIYIPKEEQNNPYLIINAAYEIAD